nr:MAG: RNA-dependent RNA polymerase [Mitovirus sp.]
MKISQINFTISPSQLISSINWFRASGHYVIQDPNNEKLLIYLDEKQYNKLMITAIATEKALVVIATPDDSKESVISRFKSTSDFSKENSPHQRWEYKASKMFSFYPGWKVKESMISFERNFEYFIPSYYKDIMSWLGSKTTKSAYRNICKLSSDMTRIYSTRGVNNLITIFKIYSIVILQYLSGSPLKSTQDLGQRVRLINGLPAKLPAFFRHLLRQNNLTHIRAILSIFQSYKGIKGIWKEPDLSSITAARFVRADKPRFDQTRKVMEDISSLLYPKKQVFIPVIHEDWREVDSSLSSFWKDFNPKGLKATLLSDSESLTLPLTAGPNHRTSALGSSIDALAIISNDDKSPLWTNFVNEAEYVAKQQGTFFPSHELSQIKMLITQGQLLLTKLLSNDREVMKLIKQVGFLKSKYHKVFKPGKTDRKSFVVGLLKDLRLGKLAIKLEPAGKVRVFAISDFWTQNLMKPLHTSLFEVLKGHSSDATFNQEGKVSDFKDKGYSFIASYDLKSATDLIPIQLYEKVLGHWTTPAFSFAWSALLTLGNI